MTPGMKTKSRQRTYLVHLLVAVITLLTFAGPVRADIEEPEMSEEDSDFQETPATIETHSHASLYSGYRFITPDGPTAAATPYGRLRSGVAGGFSAGTLGSDLKLSVDGNFLHEDDYRTELFFDYGGLVRFHVDSQALWHNLLREQVAPGTLIPVTREQDASYGVRSATSQAEARFKLGNNPIHLNLGYWELRREGSEQLRFSDFYFGTAANSLVTDTRRVDSVTREGNAGLDAHLGPIDLSYGFRIRDFSNEAAAPSYNFSNNAAAVPTGDRHNVIPDSRVTSHTVKLFSDLSGGLIGTASYNLTQRENSGSHGDATPSERPSDTIHSVAGDLSYTPSRQYSFALKYRHREIDRSTPASLLYPYGQMVAPSAGVYTAVPGQLMVRPAVSSLYDTLAFSATFRPTPKVIYRLEYNADLESRDNVHDVQSQPGSPTEIHSDSRQTHTGTAAFYWKPVTGARLNASYSYAACDNPSYGASFSGKHAGKLLATYTAGGKWGVTASYIARFETGEQTVFTVSPAPVASYDQRRESRYGSANAGFWFSPLERLALTTHYSYLEADVNQSLLFANLIADPVPVTAGSYRSSSHVYGIDAVYSVAEPLDVSLAFQQVRSRSRFEVPARTFALAGVVGTFTTDGITGLTALDSTETGVSVRADWRITELLECALDYSFRMYESGHALYDGSVHSTMVTLKARW